MGLFKNKKKDKPEETKSISFEEEDTITSEDEDTEEESIENEEPRQPIKSKKEEINNETIIRAIQDLSIRLTNLEARLFRAGL